MKVSARITENAFGVFRLTRKKHGSVRSQFSKNFSFRKVFLIFSICSLAHFCFVKRRVKRSLARFFVFYRMFTIDNNVIRNYNRNSYMI